MPLFEYMEQLIGCTELNGYSLNIRMHIQGKNKTKGDTSNLC